MIFHNKNKKIIHLIPNITINNIMIERVEDFNFLGITINEMLNWNTHISKLSTKVSKSIGILYKLKSLLPLYILKVLYICLILPHFYMAFWYGEQILMNLLNYRKKAVRVISNRTYNAHIEGIFKNLQLLKIPDIYKQCVLKFYFQYFHSQLPSYLQPFAYTFRMDIHEYNTRNKTALNTGQVTIKAAQNSIRNMTSKIVNTTPDIIINKIFTHSLNGFTTYVKQYYIAEYSFECSRNNCYICNIRE